MRNAAISSFFSTISTAHAWTRTCLLKNSFHCPGILFCSLIILKVTSHKFGGQVRKWCALILKAQPIIVYTSLLPRPIVFTLHRSFILIYCIHKSFILTDYIKANCMHIAQVLYSNQFYARVIYQKPIVGKSPLSQPLVGKIPLYQPIVCISPLHNQLGNYHMRQFFSTTSCVHKSSITTKCTPSL